MKSLRTDDILGAKPRIRHPPKNLIHQQRTYQRQQFDGGKNYPHDPYQNTIGQNYEKYAPQGYQNPTSNPYSNLNEVNLSESVHEKSPPHHSSNNLAERENARDRYQPQPQNTMEGNFGRDRERERQNNYYSSDKLQQARDRERERLRLQAAEKNAAGISSGTIGAKRAALYEEYQQKYYDVTDKQMYNGMGVIDRRVPRQYIYPKDSPAVNYDRRADSRELERRYWQEKQRQYYMNSHRDNYNQKQPTSSSRNRDYSYDQARDRQYARNYNNMEEQVYANMQKQQPQKQSTNNQKPGSSSSNDAHYRLYKEQREREQKQQQLGQPKNQPQNQAPYQPRESKGKNLFRGLGYNIITNSKFSYDMENDIKNETSKWL